VYDSSADAGGLSVEEIMWGRRHSVARFLNGIFAATVFCVTAVAAEPSFYAQCHKLLPMADDFAQECLQQARSFSRTFHPSGGMRGEVESYSTYFKTLDSPSHFVLGCVLDFRNKISFAGLYYTARPLDMSRFDTYRINFIDPSGNVGLLIDGAQNTFIAVRQFVTGIIPPRLTGRPKNCEDPHIETINGENAIPEEHFRKVDEHHIEYCYGGNSCRTSQYSTLEVHETPVIYHFHDLILVDASGALMLKEDYFKSACAMWKNNVNGIYSIIREACLKAN
jgi:hypothetical protein